MADRRRKKAKQENAGAPSWMVTYSDMVTLLLTFFVLMLSMSEMDKIKFQQVLGSLKGAFGVMESRVQQEQRTNAVIPRIEAIPYEMLQSVYKKLIHNLKELDLNPDIELLQDRGAIVLRVKDKILFAPGSADLKPGAYDVLHKVAELVAPLPFDMRIEGHTDDIPYENAR